ncbi:hypothetical protein BXY66_0330 [Shimia isoporae]|uniref:Uncharacterized protein n=1 Tax=Shimia isoporae TaxID=647720 RepID=A0A4R1NJU0_9RHOB|nr:hypothetical protein BXY66_0330 [Shimia isoporae]
MLEALRNTPSWVYLAFFLVLYYGVMYCFSSRSEPRRLLVLPLLFLVWSAYSAFSDEQQSWMSLGGWVCAVGLGGLFGSMIGRKSGARFNDAEGIIEIPGSKIPLIISLFFFGCSYWFGYTTAVSPELSATLSFQLAKTGSMAGCVGLFLGRAITIYSTSLKPLRSGEGADVSKSV